MSIFRRNGRLLVLAAAALLALLAVPARAADTRGGDNVIIGRGEVVNGDLYVAGDTVVVDGTINGDLVAIGGMVTLNGTVNGDLLVAGQSIVVNGVVSDDVRAAGQAIRLAPGARVNGDLVIGGLSLETQAGSAVQGDVLLGAYQALLAGQVGQRVLGGLDRMELRGAVGGDVDVTVSGDAAAAAVQFAPAGQLPIPAVRPNLTVADTARIGGRLTYRSTTEADIATAAQIAGGVAFDRSAATAPRGAAAAAPATPWLNAVRRLAGLALVGLLLLWLAPAWTRRLADTVEERPLPSLGWGAVAFVGFIVAVVGLLILTIVLTGIFGTLTLGGLAGMAVGAGLVGVAALIIGYIGFSAYVAQGIVAFVAGRWLLRRTVPAWAERPAAPLAVGLVLYVILSAVPWLGTLVVLAVVLLALGALWLWGRAALGRTRPTPQPFAGLQPA